MRPLPSSPRSSLRALALLASLAAPAFLSSATSAASRAASATRARRLASGISAASGLSVSPDEVHLEGEGSLGARDELFGRAVVFTGRSSRDAPRDVFRATVRLTPEGTVLALRGLVNLTVSPLGDDGPLVREGSRVAFATRAFGRVQSATVLDLDGPSGLVLDPRRGLTNVLSSGAWSGVERWDLRLERPVTSLSLSLRGRRLLARTEEGAGWSVPLGRAELLSGHGAELTHSPYVPKPLVIWAVDTVRSLSWVGPAPIAWLERRAFGLRDSLHRWAWSLRGARATAPPPELPGDGEAIARAAPRDPADRDWPPADVTCPLGCDDRGEGRWRPAAPPWVRQLEGAPPAFYRTFVRLDRQRPYTHVLVLAMDLRQLELGMQAGVEDPVPLVGPRGEGRIPRRREVLDRVVGAFNGAFKTEHGNYGMVVEGRVLLPPRGRAATVATFADGRTAMGTWPAGTALPEGLVSLRQNLDPLVADGVENPTRRYQWGFVLGGVESMPTVRSGLCSDARGHLFYVWGEETTARLLGRAMTLVGCTYGMHLDMNPTHATFNFLRVDDLRARQVRSHALAHGMQSGGSRFLYYTLKDFFYLTLRNPYPAPVRGLSWRSSGLPQAAPAWLPSLLGITVPLGGGRTVALTSVALDRVALVPRVGRRERVADAGVASLPPEDHARVLGALELGTCRGGGACGLMVDGGVVLPFAEDRAALELGPWGARLAAGNALSQGARHAVGGTFLVTRGAVVDGADTRVMPHLAVGFTADRRMLVVEGEASAAEVGALLRDAGAREGALLERGEGGPRAHWTGQGEGVREAYANTAVFLLSQPEPPRLVRLEAALPRGTGTVAPTGRGR